MSKSEVEIETKKVLYQFGIMIVLIGFVFLATIILYIRSSDKIVTEVIEESEAAQHYRDRLIDAQGAIKKLHIMIDSAEVAAVDSKRQLDSIEKIAVTQDKKIKSLQYENKVLRDSVGRDRVKVFDLHGPRNN
jgi:hypothetical protein